MRRGFWLLLVLLWTMAAPATAPSPASAEIVRLPTDVVPTYQEVSLKLDPADPAFSGSVRIELAVRAPVTSFRLHAPTARIGTITLHDSAGLVAATVDSADAQEQVTFTLSRPLEAGPAVLELTFTNVFDVRAIGLYRAKAGNDWYAMSQMEPDDCRLAFPCFDEPAFKIPWRLTLEIPDTLSAVTNVPEASSAPASSGWKKIVFRKTPPMPSYLVAVCVGAWEYVEVPGVSVPTRIVTARGMSGHVSLARELTPPICQALEEWFGSPMPYEKLDLISAPEFWPGAMENPGAILFADRNLIQDAATAGRAARRQLTSLIAHEVAHLWFGDMVTMAWWDDLWLNEAFAAWMGDRITDQLYPEFRSPITELVQTQRFLAMDARGVAPAIRQPVESTHDLLGNVGLVYSKGKRILSMFQSWVGPEAFQSGVRQYLATNAWRNAEAKDLWNALSVAGGVDVASALPTFLDQPGCPLIGVRGMPGGRIELTQRPLSAGPGPASDRRWSVPVGLSAGLPDSITRVTALVPGPESAYALGVPRAPAWIYPNRGGTGYYRWMVSPPALVALADSASRWLEPIERAEVSGNLTGLMEAGLINSGVWLNLQGKLAGDVEPMVVAAVSDNLAGNLSLLVDKADRPALAAWIRTTFRPALDRIGMQPKPDEPPGATFLRPRLINLLGRLGDDGDVIKFSRRQLDDWLANPEAVDPALRQDAFRVAVYRGDAALWEKLHAAFQVTRRPPDRRLLLLTLGAFGDPVLARKSLDSLHDPGVRPTEFFPLLGEAASDEAGKDVVFAWVRDDYAALASKVGPGLMPFLVRQLGGVSKEREAAVAAWFNDPAHAAPGTATELSRVVQDGEALRLLRNRESALLGQYLRRL
ncbi:MAG TPA: M1 family aminopeptidase [Candidatus Eisenbacteria bacterium]